MSFTTLSLKTFLAHQWGQNEESFVGQTEVACLKAQHGFITASEFSRAGEPSNPLGLEGIHFEKIFPRLGEKKQLRTDSSSSIKEFTSHLCKDMCLGLVFKSLSSSTTTPLLTLL